MHTVGKMNFNGLISRHDMDTELHNIHLIKKNYSLHQYKD